MSGCLVILTAVYQAALAELELRDMNQLIGEAVSVGIDPEGEQTKEGLVRRLAYWRFTQRAFQMDGS